MSSDLDTHVVDGEFVEAVPYCCAHPGAAQSMLTISARWLADAHTRCAVLLNCCTAVQDQQYGWHLRPPDNKGDPAPAAVCWAQAQRCVHRWSHLIALQGCGTCKHASAVECSTCSMLLTVLAGQVHGQCSTHTWPHQLVQNTPKQNVQHTHVAAGRPSPCRCTSPAPCVCLPSAPQRAPCSPPHCGWT